MPQIFMVELTDDQADALRQLADHWRESPDETLRRIVADGFDCATLRPGAATLSEALAKDDDIPF